ncbi:delta-type opioid receptor-like [Dendronephthya gigantea]|uniref:delta-type opioid receptor-like n=1 Tax=Dendronephthya gigantea TaxID=151771 RepID=UPI00106D8CD0|nr:delta-type opioid receptor-like [Dendronephthya gigantea]
MNFTTPNPNFSDTFDVSISREQLGSVVLQMCLFCLIAVIGFVANVLVLMAASQLRKHRTHRNTRSTYYIINLAIADLAIILLALPTEMVKHFTSWPFGEFSCKFLYPLRDVFVFVAIMTVTGLSIERYWVITGPFKTKPNPKHARVIIVSIWVVGYLLAGLPMVFVMKLISESPDGRIIMCDPSWGSYTEEKVHVLLSIACIILPACVITFCYIRIAKSLQRLQARRTSFVSGEAEGKPTSSVISLVEQSKKVAKMLVIIVLAFCCCVLPFTTFAVAAQFGELQGDNFLIYALLISLFFAHSAVNPIILIIMSKEYRLEVVRIVRALRDVCWKAEAVRTYFTHLNLRNDYRQHRKESENRAQLVEAPVAEGEQQRSTEL